MKLILTGQKRFSNTLLKIALYIFIIATICKLIAIGYSFVNRYDRNTSIYVIETIAKKIKNMNNIDESTKNELNKLVNEFNKQNNNGLYHIDITRYKKSSYIEYKYAKDEPKNFFSRSYEGKKGWYIAYNISEVQANNDYKLQKEALDKLPSKMGQASNYLFAFSATPLFVCLINKIFLKNTPVNK